MRNLFLIAAICGIFSFNSSSTDAQEARFRSPPRHRLMFKLFRRSRPVRSTRVRSYQPIAVPVCPTPAATANTAPTLAPAATAPNQWMPLTPNDSSSAVTSQSTTADFVPTTPEPTPADLPSDVLPSTDLPSDASDAEASPSDRVPPAPLEDGAKWRSMFDGKSLGEWKSTKFGGEGGVTIEDGQIKLDYGQYMTGITHSGKDLPKNNYEIEFEAMREDGSDFFCGLTFPVDDNHASFICGGWGGSVVGISSIDDMDASENLTTGYKVFKNKEWYKIRLRVTKDRLQAWIDDEEFVDDEITSDRLSTRIEMDRSHPLGIACFDTQAAIRNIRIRNIRIRDVTESAKKK